jgi:hypothetical protein
MAYVADVQLHRVERFVLRSSIVFDRRDCCITALFGYLGKGTVWLVENGQGICHTIYVGNLMKRLVVALLPLQRGLVGLTLCKMSKRFLSITSMRGQ